MNLLFEPFGCLICEKSHPQKPRGSPEAVLEDFGGLISPLRPNGISTEFLRMHVGQVS